jgi:hypothetical protein
VGIPEQEKEGGLKNGRDAFTASLWQLGW